jgi:hypothetical protein
MIELGAMPLPQFVKLHPEAKVTPEELAKLKAYLAPWAPAPNLSGKAPGAAFSEPHEPISPTMIQPEFNGFPFDPNFKSWKLISTTDRGDNSTFRFVLGNDVAVKAAYSGNFAPWPVGTRFAKVAWLQEPGADGLLHPGKFWQVEFMEKDAKQYKDTEGWSWGRWRGMGLKAYGKDAHFVNECTGCHKPVRGNDYVYTLPITGARSSRDEAVNNRAAALPMSLPYQPLGWSAITMYVDPKTHTTATLYGNETAIQAVHTQGATMGGPKAPEYPSDAVLALVTWAQRDDPHWFGARIPDKPLSVEFLQVVAAGRGSLYKRFSGPEFLEDHPAAVLAAQRANFVQGLVPAQLP